MVDPCQNAIIGGRNQIVTDEIVSKSIDKCKICVGSESSDFNIVVSLYIGGTDGSGTDNTLIVYHLDGFVGECQSAHIIMKCEPVQSVVVPINRLEGLKSTNRDSVHVLPAENNRNVCGRRESESGNDDPLTVVCVRSNPSERSIGDILPSSSVPCHDDVVGNVCSRCCSKVL